MKLDIISRVKEPNLKREKIEIKAFFKGEPIPSKQSIIDHLLANDSSLIKEQLLVRKVETHFGQSTLLSTLYYYVSLDALKQTEQDYIKTRNKIKDNEKPNNIQQNTIDEDNKKTNDIQQNTIDEDNKKTNDIQQTTKTIANISTK
ncbi:MAG: hypothetical protein COW47_01445 [Candidatus Huberarchaeum crystalense]|uniref:30S ribosomal protein S24e n=1 Tax=Huberarchaeum crystalense TaxID=2014257 RepID=A0A2G9LJI5_HUBC1|nr:hypothetical protein [archaeon]PIN66685.1 MAG: hypothetical protein COW69_00950 [Candidatus Huberarchaeum crystalense]PIV89706.1 MAG: hypothetical protein COW47_01445 [Candidatus Huberarchaeum crystalense]PJC01604.1 MAG: hypothetical protein CO072_00675 [Candidatus Huberarchaeum crystalense]